MRVHQRCFYGSVSNTMLGLMEATRRLYSPVLDGQGWTGRRVTGYKLPTWQRPEVWTDEPWDTMRIEKM